jgi:hypothetical protein
LKERKSKVIIVEPSERLVYGVLFAMCCMCFLSAIEVASLALLHMWNSEVFAAITSLIGLVTGTLISVRS